MPDDLAVWLPGSAASPFFLVAEHAGNAWPQELGTLGVARSDRARHIAYDLGIGPCARALAALCAAPLLLSVVSRLVVDLNRAAWSAEVIPAEIDATPIAGNRGLSAHAHQQRIDRFHEPFHRFLDEKIRAHRPQALVSLHSFTRQRRCDPYPRDLDCGILFARAGHLGQALLAALCQEPQLRCAVQQPYSVRAQDCTLSRHGDDRGLPAVIIEIRQDLLASPQGIQTWARRLAKALPQALAHAPPIAGRHSRPS